MSRHALVVDLLPWPAPVDRMVTERFASALQQACSVVRVWHPLRADGDPAGAAAATAPGLGAVILTGAMTMVDEGPPWLQTLGDALDGWIARRVPVLATCFGHQFVAHHLGGRLGSYPGPRIGLFPLHVRDPQDPLLAPLGPSPEMYWSHRDFVAQVPDVLQVTAGSDTCPVEAFRHRDAPLWGVQAHPEADAALAEAIVRVEPDSAPAMRRRPWPAYDTPAGDRLLQAFVAVAGDSL